MYVCMYVFMYVSMYVCMYVCTSVCVCMYVCMYVSMYVCKYIRYVTFIRVQVKFLTKSFCCVLTLLIIRQFGRIFYAVLDDVFYIVIQYDIILCDVI